VICPDAITTVTEDTEVREEKDRRDTPNLVTLSTNLSTNPSTNPSTNLSTNLATQVAMAAREEREEKVVLVPCPTTSQATLSLTVTRSVPEERVVREDTPAVTPDTLFTVARALRVPRAVAARSFAKSPSVTMSGSPEVRAERAREAAREAAREEREDTEDTTCLPTPCTNLITNLITNLHTLLGTTTTVEKEVREEREDTTCLTTPCTNLITNPHTLLAVDTLTTVEKEAREEREAQATGKPSVNLLTQHHLTL